MAPTIYDCWPVDHSCCQAKWDTYPPETQDRADALAVTTLRSLTGYRVGGCPVVVRPCRVGCGETTWRTYPAGVAGAGGGFYPVLASGRWLNIGCGCAADGCSCATVCEVRLDGDSVAVAQVKVDGLVLDPTAYRIDNGNRLTRIDGECWPLCQNMNAEDDQPGTFSVTYTPGVPVDGLAEFAAGLLACEFAKACTGGDCVLPSGVTQVARSGVTYTIAADAFAGGTGVREVDAFVRRWNPHRLTGPSLVWSPDVPHGRATG
jgi:hypothetical protein